MQGEADRLEVRRARLGGAHGRFEVAADPAPDVDLVGHVAGELVRVDRRRDDLGREVRRGRLRAADRGRDRERRKEVGARAAGDGPGAPVLRLGLGDRLVGDRDLAPRARSASASPKTSHQWPRGPVSAGCAGVPLARSRHGGGRGLLEGRRDRSGGPLVVRSDHARGRQHGEADGGQGVSPGSRGVRRRHHLPPAEAGTARRRPPRRRAHRRRNRSRYR